MWGEWVGGSMRGSVCVCMHEGVHVCMHLHVCMHAGALIV